MKSLSRVQLFATPWTIAYQAPRSIEFSRQEYWNGLPFPSPGNLPNQGSNPYLPHCRQTRYRLSHQGSKSSFKVPCRGLEWQEWPGPWRASVSMAVKWGQHLCTPRPHRACGLAWPWRLLPGGAAFVKGWIPPSHAQLAFPPVSLGWVAERWHD